MFRKTLVFGIITLFICASVVPSNAIKPIVEKSYTILSASNTLYVGGNGPGNYTCIQDAINDALEGDTVFVYDDSSPYYELVRVDKSIQLIGENKETTIIDGLDKADINIVKIIADNVKLSGFTFQNVTRPDTQAVQIVNGNENIITDNIFTNNYCSIFIFPAGEEESDKNIISYNFIKDSGFHGIAIGSSSENLITKNIVHHCVFYNRYGGGISVSSGYNNIISYNDVKYNGVGISTRKSDNIVVKFNNVCENYVGIHNFVNKNNVEVVKNNIYQNRGKDCFHNYMHPSPKVNVNNNYWGRPMILPKIIPGLKYIYLFSIKIPINYDEYYKFPIYIPAPSIDFDRNPMKEPYDI